MKTYKVCKLHLTTLFMWEICFLKKVQAREWLTIIEVEGRRFSWRTIFIKFVNKFLFPAKVGHEKNEPTFLSYISFALVGILPCTSFHACSSHKYMEDIPLSRNFKYNLFHNAEAVSCIAVLFLNSHGCARLKTFFETWKTKVQIQNAWETIFHLLAHDCSVQCHAELGRLKFSCRLYSFETDLFFLYVSVVHWYM